MPKSSVFPWNWWEDLMNIQHYFKYLLYIFALSWTQPFLNLLSRLCDSTFSLWLLIYNKKPSTIISDFREQQSQGSVLLDLLVSGTELDRWELPQVPVIHPPAVGMPPITVQTRGLEILEIPSLLLAVLESAVNFWLVLLGREKDEKPQEKELQWWVEKDQCRLGVTRSHLAACPTLIHAAGNYKGERIVMDPKPAILHKVSENGRMPSQPSTCMVCVLWDSRTLIFAVLAALGPLIKVAGDGWSHADSSSFTLCGISVWCWPPCTKDFDQNLAPLPGLIPIIFFWRL